MSVWRKPTFSGVFTNFKSFVSGMHKRVLVRTLPHRSFRLSFRLFQLRELSSGNGNFKLNIQAQKLSPKHMESICYKVFQWIIF